MLELFLMPSILSCRSILAKLLEDPNARARHGSMLLRAWDKSNVAFKGILGLSRENSGGFVSVGEESCMKAAAKAAICAIDLSQGLNGDTRMTCPRTELGMNELTVERKKMGFPTGWGGVHWSAFSDFNESSFPVGACSRITIGLLEAMEPGNNFNDVHTFKDFDERYELKPMVTLASQARSGGNPSDVASYVLLSCDKALVSAEYVFKFISGGAGVGSPDEKEGRARALDLIGLRMLVVAELIAAIAPCAVGLDENLSIALYILRLARRLYQLNVRVVNFLIAGKLEPRRGFRLYLTEMRARCTPVISELLLSIQEYKQIGEGSSGVGGEKRCAAGTCEVFFSNFPFRS